MVRALTMRVALVDRAVRRARCRSRTSAEPVAAAPAVGRRRMKLYEQLAEHVAALIATGSLRAAERLPSVRQLARERRVSVATATHAYEVLEARGLVETRPRSGYYVSARRQQRTPAAPRDADHVAHDARRRQRARVRDPRRRARARRACRSARRFRARRCFRGERSRGISARPRATWILGARSRACRPAAQSCAARSHDAICASACACSPTRS